jgi:hypothetical protein
VKKRKKIIHLAPSPVNQRKENKGAKTFIGQLNRAMLKENDKKYFYPLDNDLLMGDPLFLKLISDESVSAYYQQCSENQNLHQ